KIVLVTSSGDLFADFDFTDELFGNLTFQCLPGRFVNLNLASRELPMEGEVAAGASLCTENLVAIDDDGSDYVNNLHMPSLQLGISLGAIWGQGAATRDSTSQYMACPRSQTRCIQGATFSSTVKATRL